MFPGINPKDMAKAMKQMGVKQDEIEVDQVIFKMKDHDIIFDNPSVVEVDMSGEKSYQINGQNRIEQREEIIEITDEDIQTVSSQAGVDLEKAEEALMNAEGDIAQAIINLSENNN